MKTIGRYWLFSLLAAALVGGGLVVGLLLGRANNDDRQLIFPFEHPAFGNPEVTGRRVVERVVLERPEPAYNFRLTNMDSQQMQLDDFTGKLVLVGFIYTNCPDVCGLLTQHYRYIQQVFADAIGEDLELIFITTDPERDTPERLAAYTRGFQGRWKFFTGTERQLKNVWKHYDVFVTEGRAGTDLVIHSYLVNLIDRDGMTRYRYVGLVDPEETIVQDISLLLNEG